MVSMLNDKTAYLINGRWSLEIDANGISGTLKKHGSHYWVEQFRVTYFPARNYLQASYNDVPASVLQAVKRRFKLFNGK